MFLAGVLASCGGADPAADGAGGPSTKSIEVVNIAYAPGTLEVNVGQEVVWTNKDQGVRHTVTSGTPGDNGVPGVTEGTASKPDGLFDGDLLDAASEFSFTFEEDGTFAYFCKVHPSMIGKIIVG